MQYETITGFMIYECCLDEETLLVIHLTNYFNIKIADFFVRQGTGHLLFIEMVLSRSFKSPKLKLYCLKREKSYNNIHHKFFEWNKLECTDDVI